MSETFDKLLDRPMSHKISFWVGSLVVITFIFWQYFYSPESEKYTKLEEEIESLNTQIAQEQRIARNLVKFREEVKELDVKFKFALQELPDEREIPDLLSSISNLARDAGLEVTFFKPAQESLKDFYAEVPVNVSVDGTFHQVATFFDEVGQLPRIVNINQIAIHNPTITDTEVRIKTDCVATTFRYLDEKERALMATQDVGGDSKKKKRRK